ncbi:hypothetical protein C9374_001027 [Naegleria lovaniensis]|uniref:Uncharacterized protein n=1 Tax=Naegleria lovaniensis TaxID=51637 RepID=A0AA88GSP6_NAELO|nr:uncharacterized protein C9374_001027 [Naegleria lovaniensis]KAG2388177.1 hypothetical protein C9374_001027 [Naegleria lovaniensis]
MKSLFNRIFGSNSSDSQAQHDLEQVSSSYNEQEQHSINHTPKKEQTTNRYYSSNHTPIQFMKRSLAQSSCRGAEFMKENGNKRTKLFTSGSNDSAQMGFEKKSISDSGGEWIQVHQIKGLTPTESEVILNKINVIAVGRSHSLFATTDGGIYGCGKNNYNQLGNTPTFHGTTDVELFTCMNDEILRAMKQEKEAIRERLTSSSSSSSSNHQNALQEFLNSTHFDHIYTVDHISCGWFHTLIIVNGNIILGAGHSYFGQLFGADFNKNFAVLNSKIELFNNFSNGNPYCQYTVTHSSCGTFSSCVVFNRFLIYHCGEASKGGNFAVPNCSELKSPVRDIAQTDASIYVMLEDHSLHCQQKESDHFKMEQRHVAAFGGGHMSNTSYWIKEMTDNPVVTTSDQKNMELFSVPPKLGAMEIEFFGGYYCMFGVINKKILFMHGNKLNSAKLTDIPFTNGLFSPLISAQSLMLSTHAHNKKLAEYLFMERYNIECVQSGCDVNLLLISEYVGNDFMKTRLLKQVTDENYQRFCDIEII